MAKSSQSTENAQRMLRELLAVDALAKLLVETAPVAVAQAGGAQALITKFGHPTGAWFWTLSPMPETLWLKMSAEHQASSRASVGD